MKRIILLISLFITSLSYGQVETMPQQENTETRRHFFDDISVGASLNHALISGDVYGLSSYYLNDDFENPIGDDNYDFGVGLRIAKPINKFFNIGLELNVGRMTGVKDWDKNKNYEAWQSEMNYKNVNISSRFYFSKLFAYKNRKPKALGYVDLAGGFMVSDAKIKWVSNGITDSYKDPHSNTETALTLGLGGGVEFLLVKKLSLDLGTKFFWTNSDEIDGIYKAVDPTVQNKYNDVFWLSHLGLNYDLSKDVYNSESYKWHYGELVDKDLVYDENNNVRVDTVIIYVQDTTIINKLDTVVDKVTEIIEVEAAATKPAFSPVFFDTDSYQIRQDQVSAINMVGNYLITNPKVKVVLHGYADKRGSSEHNLKLSKKRVESVKSVLVNVYNVDASRIETDYTGEENLKIDQDNLNRRVDFDVR